MAACDPYEETDIIRMIESKAFETGDLLRNQTIYTMECATGGRINELLKLQLKDVIDSHNRIRRQISFTETKNKTTITVDFINDLAIMFLEVWLKRVADMGYMQTYSPLFPSPVRGKQAISSRQIYNIYDKGHKELKLEGHYGTHSCRKTWVKDTYYFYEKQMHEGKSSVNPLTKLFATGRWKTMDAMMRYCAFLMGDTSESQAALYPRARKHFKNMISEKYQTGTNTV